MRNNSEKRAPFGFTLLELMVVVIIISILAGVGLPMFSRYIKRTRTTEAFLNLRKMYDGEIAYFQEDHVAASGATISRQFIVTRIEPGWPPTDRKKLGNFSDARWGALKFSPDGPVYYAYFADAFPFNANYPFRPPEFDIVAQGGPSEFDFAFMVSAVGDIDADGKFSLFERSGGLKAGDSDVTGQPAFFSLDPME